MANYLERVASSAARRAAVAKPPTSGPPLLPAKDLSLPVEGSLPHYEADSFEAAAPAAPEKRESPRSEKLSQVTPAINKTAPTETPKPRHDAVALVEPLARPARPALARQESLSSEAPFTVHLPKTLRPLADNNIQAKVENEQPQPRHTPASIPTKEIAAEFSNVDEPRAAVPRSSDLVAEQPATFAGEETHVRPDDKANEAAQVDEPRPAPVKHAVKQGPVQVVIPEPIPIDRNERSIQVPAQHVSARNEPVPAAALPVQLPSPVAAGSQRRQEQSRVHIGSLEVTVNNHPPAIPARTARPTSLQNDQMNLERRYLDRFRLKR